MHVPAIPLDITSDERKHGGVAHLFLHCPLPHGRTSHVTSRVAKEAGKWSSWQGGSFPMSALCCGRGEWIFVDS